MLIFFLICISRSISEWLCTNTQTKKNHTNFFYLTKDRSNSYYNQENDGSPIYIEIFKYNLIKCFSEARDNHERVP